MTGRLAMVSVRCPGAKRLPLDGLEPAVQLRVVPVLSGSHHRVCRPSTWGRAGAAIGPVHLLIQEQT